MNLHRKYDSQIYKSEFGNKNKKINDKIRLVRFFIRMLKLFCLLHTVELVLH